MGTNHSRHCKKLSMSDEDLLARLATAAYKGCERDLKNLLKAGAFRFIDDFTMRGKSALHNAARSGQCSCVKILLEHNAYVNIASYDRRTPLMEAAEQGYSECLIMLLNYGADPNTVSTDQMTALHYAARNGHSDCVEKLLQSGSNVNAIASGGWTSLHFAARHAHSTCVKLLLQYNAQVEPPTTKRCLGSPLQHAALLGDSSCIELLLNAGSNVNSTDEKGWTPLHFAVSAGKLQNVETLIRYGADVNAVTSYVERSSYKDTPLHIALFYRFQDCALRLIQANAKLKCRNEPNGETPIDLARKRQLLTIYRYMENISRTPPTLKSQCCSQIRQSLKPDVVTRVKKLSISREMQNEILYPKFLKLQE